MSRKFKFVCVFLVLLGIIVSYLFLSSDQKIKRVLIVTIDTLRADHLSAYGYPLQTTPFFDSLAKQGVVFERALTASSHTAPSHTTMFTSLFPYQHRVVANHDRLPVEIPNIHSLFSQAGYDTVALSAVKFMEGKVGFPNLPQETDLPGSDVTREFWFRSAETQVNRAIHWLKNRNSSNPFLMWVHFYDVHAWQQVKPGQVPTNYFSELIPENIDQHADYLIKQHSIPESWYKSKEDMVMAISRYDARLRYVDDQIKRLAEFMQAQGIWEDTLVVILADHGEGLGNHNYAGHGMYIYNEQLHIPLLFSVPGQNWTAKRIGQQVRTADLLPTIADLLSLELPSTNIPYQGVSLKKIITGKGSTDDKVHEYSFAERRPRDQTRLRRNWKDGEFHAIQNMKWKLILHSLGEHELYNLEEDPFELNNIFKQHPDVLERHKKIIEALLKLPRAGQPVPEQLNDAQLDELRSLGYL